MKKLFFLALMLAGTALGQDLKPVLVKPVKPVVDLLPIDGRVISPRIKTVTVPYYLSLLAQGNKVPVKGSCSLEYKGIVLDTPYFSGKDQFSVQGRFTINHGTKTIQVRCQIDGYDPIHETVELVGNSLKAELCFCNRSLYQRPIMDVNQGIARVRIQVPRIREQKIWLNGRTFVQLSTDHPEVVANSYNGDPLLPEILLTQFHLALPLDAEIAGVVVKPGQSRGGQTLPLVPKAEDSGPKFPAQVPPRFDEKSYYSGKNEILVERDSRFQLIRDRQQNIVKVSVPLVDFDAHKAVLRYYEDLEVIVSFKSSTSCFRPPYRGRDAVDVYHARQLVGLSQLVLNPQDIQAGCRDQVILRDSPLNPTLMQPTLETIGLNLLIVAPRDFKEEAERLRLHKETLGIRTSVFYWEGETAAELKDQLAAAAQNLRPNFMQWILLLGDVDRIPTYYDAARGDPQYGDYALSAGDVFYTQYPESNVSYTPSLDPKASIGRIPAKNRDELKRVINRIIAYENAPPTVDHYYQSPTIAATLQVGTRDTGSPNNYAEFVENNLSQKFFQAGFKPERIYRTDTKEAVQLANWSPSKPIDYASLTRAQPEIPTLLFHWDGEQEMIDSAFKRGSSFLMYRGHATTDKWAWPGFGYDPKRFSLYPKDKPPVVFSIACLAGFFDSESIHAGHITSSSSGFQTVDPQARFMGEQMLLDGNGALGIVAASRQSSQGYNNRLTLGFGRSLIDQQVNAMPLSQRLGDMVVDAKVFAKKINAAVDTGNILENTNRHHLLVYNLLGDPSVELRQATPLRVQGEPSVQYDGQQKTLRVRFRMEAIACPGCDLSQQTEQPIAVLMDENGHIVHRALANTMTSESGENREVILMNVTNYWGTVLKLYLSHAGLIPYQHVIDNRVD